MAHKLKIVLKYTDPQVYRTVIVPEKFTFQELHQVIHCVMNWNDSHIYQFNLGAPYASDTIKLMYEEDNFADIFGDQYEEMDATNTYLAAILNGQRKKINYTYDFGDDWLHEIRVLKKPEEAVIYPKCIKGENAAPIDDCGSYPGFYELIEASKKKKKNQAEKELLEWYGIPLNADYEDFYAFDLEDVNEMLLEVFEA